MDNGKKKFHLMKKMQKIIHRDLPWIMQFYARNWHVERFAKPRDELPHLGVYLYFHVTP